MLKQNYKIIYSLRIHLALQSKGFKCLTVMPNPQNPNYNCWTYEKTDELMEELANLIGGGGHGKQ